MNEKDAHIAREVAIDELKTTNKYEALASSTDSKKVKDVVKDIAREEKVHTGEAAALLDEADPEAKPAMKEGAEEVKAFKESAMPSFAELFAHERGKVLEKTGMLTDEGLAEFKRSVFAKAGDFSHEVIPYVTIDSFGNEIPQVDRVESPNPGLTSGTPGFNPALDYDPLEDKNNPDLAQWYKSREILDDTTENDTFEGVNVPQHRAVASVASSKRPANKHAEELIKQDQAQAVKWFRNGNGVLMMFTIHVLPEAHIGKNGGKYPLVGRAYAFSNGDNKAPEKISSYYYTQDALNKELMDFHKDKSILPLKERNKLDNATEPNGNARGDAYRDIDTGEHSSYKGDSKEVRRGKYRQKLNDMAAESHDNGQILTGSTKIKNDKRGAKLPDGKPEKKKESKPGSKEYKEKKAKLTEAKQPDIKDETAKLTVENEKHDRKMNDDKRNGPQTSTGAKGSSFMPEGDKTYESEEGGYRDILNDYGKAPDVKGIPAVDEAFEKLVPKEGPFAIQTNDFDAQVRQNLEANKDKGKKEKKNVFTLDELGL